MDTDTTARLMRAARARGFAPTLSGVRPLVPRTIELFLRQPGQDRLYPGTFYVLAFNPAVFASGGPAATSVTLSTPGADGGEFDMGTLPSFSQALSFVAWHRVATVRHGCAGCGRLVMDEYACPYDRGFCLTCCACDEHAGMPQGGL